jgi:glycosyltransferase involved in cell wall biosynthesis
MKLVLTIAGLSPEFGGPSRSVPALAEAMAREDVVVDLITCESQGGYGSPVLPNQELVRTQLLPARSREGRWQARRNDFFCALCETSNGMDTVIHDNGLWLPTNHAVAGAARFLNRPLLISPRGMLTSWASAHHRWKKRAAWTLFQQRDLFSASALHGTSEQEAIDFRKTGYRGPIAIVPNGVELPELMDEPPIARDTRTALCVTRIHPVKGLMNLVEAWSTARPGGWRMIIAGSDEEGHRAELESAVAARGLTGVFEFVGPVEGEQKQKLYREADLFILPSHSENFGMSIAEALAHNLPVITTRGTPWKDLIECHCGWWVEIGADPLARALAEVTQMDDQTRRQMGERGRQLVAQEYSWSRVAKEMKSVYQWLLGRGERPQCVRLG